MGVLEKGLIVRKFIFTLAREEISQRTGSIVSFRPTSLSTHTVDFFRWPSFCFRLTGNKESTTDSSSSKFDRIRLEAFFFT